VSSYLVLVLVRPPPSGSMQYVLVGAGSGSLRSLLTSILFDLKALAREKTRKPQLHG